MIRQCEYCNRMISRRGRTNHLFVHAGNGLLTAWPGRERYEFVETPKGRKIRLGLRRAARMAAQCRK